MSNKIQLCSCNALNPRAFSIHLEGPVHVPKAQNVQRARGRTLPRHAASGAAAPPLGPPAPTEGGHVEPIWGAWRMAPGAECASGVRTGFWPSSQADPHPRGPTSGRPREWGVQGEPAAAIAGAPAWGRPSRHGRGGGWRSTVRAACVGGSRSEDALPHAAVWTRA